MFLSIGFDEYNNNNCKCAFVSFYTFIQYENAYREKNTKNKPYRYTLQPTARSGHQFEVSSIIFLQKYCVAYCDYKTNFYFRLKLKHYIIILSSGKKNIFVLYYCSEFIKLVVYIVVNWSTNDIPERVIYLF